MLGLEVKIKTIKMNYQRKERIEKSRCLNYRIFIMSWKAKVILTVIIGVSFSVNVTPNPIRKVRIHVEIF